MDKRLQRSNTDKWIVGVAGGVAAHFGIPSWLVRLLFVIFAFGGLGTGILIYVILAFLMSPPDSAAGKMVSDGLDQASELVGKAADKLENMNDDLAGKKPTIIDQEDELFS